MEQSLGFMMERECWGVVANMLQSRQGRREAKTAVYSVGASPHLITKWHPAHALKEYAQQVTALHLACLYCAPSYIIELLLHDGCGGATACSKVALPCGETPLHFAVRGAVFLAMKKSPVRHRQGRRNIEILLEKRPLSVTCASDEDWGGRSPLHIACQNRASSKVICMLVTADPEGAGSVRTTEGYTARDLVEKTSMHPLWRRRVLSILPNDHRRDDVLDTPVRMKNIKANSKGQVANGGNNKSLLCVSCRNGKASHGLVPCGHVCLCKTCAKGSRFNRAPLYGHCPVCKCVANQSVQLFSAGIITNTGIID